MEQEAERFLINWAFPLFLRERVPTCPAKNAQMIAIARVLTQNVRLVIMMSQPFLFLYPYQQKTFEFDR